MKQKLNELSKKNENLVDKNNKKTAVLKEFEEVQATSLKAGELAKTKWFSFILDMPRLTINVEWKC